MYELYLRHFLNKNVDALVCEKKANSQIDIHSIRRILIFEYPQAPSMRRCDLDAARAIEIELVYFCLC